MPIDFNDLAKSAKKNHETRLAQNEKDRQDKEALRLKIIRDDISFFDDKVLPLLSAAQAAFSGDEILIVVKKQYDVESYLSRFPSIEIRFSKLIGAPEKDARTETPPVTISRENSKLKCHIKHGNDYTKDKTLTYEDADTCVEKVVRHLADNLYGKLEGMA